MTTTTDCAIVLAKRLGVTTSAKTVRGILAAIRRARPARKPAWHPPVPTRRRLPASWLLETGWQGRARQRTVDDAEPLRAALSAALGQDATAIIDVMPNRYKYPAEASVVSSRRVGQAIVMRRGRENCGSMSYGGRSARPATDGDFVMARDVLALFPRLPAGWRLRADEYGPYLAGPGVSDYHPTAGQLAAATTDGWGAIIATARDMAAARRTVDGAKRRAMRVARLAGRIAGELTVTTLDSVAAGNCAAGTRAWARQHGIAGDSTTAAVLARFAADRRVAAAVYAAYRRARS